MPQSCELLGTNKALWRGRRPSGKGCVSRLADQQGPCRERPRTAPDVGTKREAALFIPCTYSVDRDKSLALSRHQRSIIRTFVRATRCIRPLPAHDRVADAQRDRPHERVTRIWCASGPRRSGPGDSAASRDDQDAAGCGARGQDRGASRSDQHNQDALLGPRPMSTENPSARLMVVVDRAARR